MRLSRPLLIAALSALLLPGAASARPDRIIDGESVDIAAVPYQAALLDTTRDNGAGSAFDEQICGATILDATHLATASHCVTDEKTGALEPAADFEVLVGVTNLSEGNTDAGESLALPVQKVKLLAAPDGVKRNPSYDHQSEKDDSTLLTLATPLVFSASVQPIGGLVASKPTSGPLLISGWGCVKQYDADNTTACQGDPGDYPDDLMDTTIHVVPDSTCAGEYNDTTQTSFYPDAMLCGGDPGKDTCQGDSGGPTVVVGTVGDFSSYELAGITSFGDGCADPNFAGIYANVADATVSSVLARPAITTSPASIAPPALTEDGDGVLTCDPGEWTGSPTFAYAFSDSSGVLQAESGLTTYVRQPADAGKLITCEVFGHTPAGNASTTATQATAGPTTTTTTPSTTTAPPATSTPTTTPPGTTTSPTTTTAPPLPTPPPVSSTVPPVTTPPPLPKDLTPPSLTLSATKIKLSRKGTFKLTLGAPGEAATTSAKLALSKRVKGKKVSLGTKTASTSAPASPTVLTFKLKASTAKLLRKQGKLKLSIVLTSTDDAGNTATKTLSVTLVK